MQNMIQSQDPQSPNRERLETFSIPTRLNADNSNKKVLFIFWLLFALFEIAVLVTSNFTPYAFLFKTNESELSNTKYTECTNPVIFNEGILSCLDFSLKNPKIGLIMKDLSTMNQFAQINLLFLPKANNPQTITVKQEFKVELMTLKRKQMVFDQNKKATVFEKGQKVKTINHFEFDSNEYPLSDIQWSQDATKKGYKVRLGFYRQFKQQDALLILTFLNLTQEYLDNFKIEPQAILMNSSYTIFIIVLRAVFLGIMALTFSIYLYKLKQIQPCIEQKIVFVLSGFAILFNDPYYFISVFKPNLLCISISTGFVTSFFIAVVISWVSLLDKIRASLKQQVFSFDKARQTKYGIIAISYFIIVFLFIFEVGYYSFTQSPIIPHNSTFNRLYIATVVLTTVIFLYIVWLYLTIIKDWHKVLWRDKIYSVFNIFFILLNFIFIILGWFSFYDESSQKFQIFYASMNFYVIYLQYMYTTPFQQNRQTLKSHQELNEVTTDNQINSYYAEDAITIELSPKQQHQDKQKLENQSMTNE